jgi:nickel-dependent lactate racemase
LNRPDLEAVSPYMPLIDLKYGRHAVPFEYADERFDVLRSTSGEKKPLSDVEIGDKLDQPIDSEALDDLIKPGESILIVVSDATRQTGSAQIVNLLVRRLIAAGSAAFDIRIIFATGIHRKVNGEERGALLTPFINQRIKTLDHDPRDLAQLIRLGETSGGIPVELNRALIDHDHVILVGGVSFHYFAGFTGGRKLICPGLGSSRTVSETHKLAFDCSQMARRSGVRTGRLGGNAVHEAFVEAARKVKLSFAINSVVNDAGEIVDVYCGNWLTSHGTACDQYAVENTVRIKEQRDIVIVSCGGYPHDINMIQAHKALNSAAQACRNGGTILLLAECDEGTGRKDFLAWFAALDSAALAIKLCEKYQVNGQTAWSLLQITEQYQIKVVTSLSEETTNKMRLQKVEVSSAIELCRDPKANGYIMPSGAKVAVETSDQE